MIIFIPSIPPNTNRVLATTPCGSTKAVPVSTSSLRWRDGFEELDVVDSYSLDQLFADQGIPSNYYPAPGRYLLPGAVKAYTNTSLGKQITYKQRVKAGGTYKEFEAAKKQGRIVLKPLYAIDASYSDAPSLDGAVNQGSKVSMVGIPVDLTIVQSCNASVRAVSYPQLPLGQYEPYALSRINAGETPWFCPLTYTKYQVSGRTIMEEHGSPDLHYVAEYLRQVEVDTSLKNEALDELYSGVYDVLTELGELPETVKYLYDVLRRIILLAANLRSKEVIARKRFKGKELVDEISSLWMQFRYAVSPLAYSAQDVMKLLDAQITEYQSARKRADQPFEFSHAGYTYAGTFEGRVFGKIRIDATSKSVGLGLNPVKTLWELTPLSFVVDWVLPVGSMLGALVAPTHVRQTALMESVTIRSLSMRTSSGSLSGNLSFYHARPTYNVPNLAMPDVFLNWKRVLDSLALSWGLFLKQHWKS